MGTFLFDPCCDCAGECCAECTDTPTNLDVLFTDLASLCPCLSGVSVTLTKDAGYTDGCKWTGDINFTCAPCMVMRVDFYMPRGAGNPCNVAGEDVLLRLTCVDSGEFAESPVDNFSCDPVAADGVLIPSITLAGCLGSLGFAVSP
jgi:hypothetical protein